MTFALSRFATAALAVLVLSGPLSVRAEDAPAEGGEVRYVIIDGKKMTWDEAKKKYPDLPDPSVAAPAETVNVETPAATEAPAAAEEPAATEAPVATEAPAVTEAPAETLADQAMTAGSDPEYDKRVAMEKARRAITLEEEIHKNIRRLAMPGWRTAESKLIEIGKPAVPFLIEAMKPGEKPYPESTFQIRAPVRKVRQLPLEDVVYEVLHNMVHNHSTYKGTIPARDYEKWKEFWATNSGSILFGQEAIMASPVVALPAATQPAEGKAKTK